MILASMLTLATFAAPAPLLGQPSAAAAQAPVCQGAPGRPSLCRPATAGQSDAAPVIDSGTRVAIAACHPDPGKNRGCFRRTPIGGETALARNAPVREDAR